jgi:fatty acid synthase
VNFEPVVRSLPKGVVIVEVGPHALLKSIIKRCRTAENEESPVLLSTMRRGHSAVDHISSLIDSLWLEGVCFNFPRTQNMVPIRNRVNMEWDHDVLWRTPQFSDFSASSGSSSELKIKFDLAGKDAFLMDHVIDGHPLLPATAHIYCAWAAFETEEIHFVDIKILAAVMLDGESLSLKVVTNETGWKIYSDDKLVSQGTIAKEYQIPSVSEGNFSDSIDDKEWVDKSTVYSRFARYGYEYGEAFRVIQRRSTDGRNVILDSACHWIAYLDNILQAFLNNPSGLFLPTSIATVSIRCKDVKDASCILVQNCDLNSFGNSDVTIRGLKTSVMKKTHKAPTIRGVEFIPYGEHIIVHEEDFKCQLITYLSSAAASTGDSLVDENVKACLVELLEEAGKAVDVVPTIPRFEEDLRMKNQVLSCNWCVDGLDIISQVIRENFTRSYSVLRVGDHSIPSDDLFRLLDPLISHDVDNQSYKSISESWEVNFPVDTIILANALYASTNVSDTLLNVVNTLPDGGFLVVREYIGILPNLLWGNQVTPTDDTRNNGRWMTKSTILERVTSVGLDVVVWYVDKSSTQLVILAVKPRSGEVTNVSSRHEMSAAPYNLVTEDYGHLGFIRSLRKEPGYNDINLSLTLPSSSPVDKDAISATYSLPFHISSDGVTGGIHEVPLRSIDKKNGKATTRGFHLRVTRPGDLESLTWIENDVESNCEVRFCGINFKDVMLSYGKLASADSGGHVKIGLEFSGEIEGKPVMGIAAGCMATHIQTPKHLLWEVPNSLSLEAACTLPVVYSTVYYALVIKANIREGQTVLIHSIGGGVGQAAFHVCKHRGVKVIATCSSAKKDWVHSHLGISRDLILDSHGLDFRDAVLSLTSGAGVDVVLNSLSGEKLQASLDCVGQYGHFCEIGKYDIQQNMPIGMGIFERNISIHGFDLSDMFNKPRLWQPVRDLLTAGLKSGEVKPLCLTVFDDAEQALRHMSSGKHIGKVLVRLPKASDVNIAAGGTTVGISRHLRSFRTNGTHLVVGGLGGFGFELVAFLQARGAEHIIISSRGNPKPFQQRILGDTVTVTHVNLKDTKSCDEFIQGEGNNLVGIWHLGMVLNDCLYDNMSTSAWDETVSTKKDICINLDLSSRSYCKNLKHFVMWSSVSALYGNPGQTNYAYANSAMEGVCMARHQAGLPGIAIQWGFIGSVGVLAQNQTTNASLTFSPQHIDSCLESLDSILPSEHAVVSCYIRQFDMAGEDGDGGVKTLSVSQRVARVLGLDPVKINSTDMLSSLGMDSLQSVEIANVLKMAGLVKALDELRGMTWTEILNFD